MAKFRVNPDEAWKSLPKGEYTVMVTNAVVKDPKQGEHQYIEVTMEVLEGEFKGENIIDRLSLSPKARPRLASFIRACGLATPGSGGEQEFDTDDLISRVLTVKGDIETFQGVERFRPSSFKMHPDVAKSIEAQLNQGKPAASAPSAAAPAPAPASAPAAAPARRITRSI